MFFDLLMNEIIIDLEKYKSLTKRLLYHIDKDGNSDNSEKYKQLLIQRSNIIKNAQNKLE